MWCKAELCEHLLPSLHAQFVFDFSIFYDSKWISFLSKKCQRNGFVWFINESCGISLKLIIPHNQMLQDLLAIPPYAPRPVRNMENVSTVCRTHQHRLHPTHSLTHSREFTLEGIAQFCDPPDCCSRPITFPTTVTPPTHAHTAACVCDCGWFGPACDRMICPGHCSGHGRCREGKCFCHPGYYGIDCSRNSCPNECNGHGECNDGVCKCQVIRNWMGCPLAARIIFCYFAFISI